MNAREIILKALYNIEEKGEYFTHALSSSIALCEERDRSFVTEVIYGVIKNKTALDYIIMQFSSVKMKKMTPWVRNILRMGTFQMYYMDKIPHSAACNESVKLSKKYAHTAAGRFINGVLRNISRNIDNIRFPSAEEPVKYLSTFYSYPEWMTEKLLDQYGFDDCESFMSESNKSHGVTLRVNPLLSNPEKVTAALESEGVHAEVLKNSPALLTVSGKININNLKSYKNGLFSLQNFSSYKAVEALDPKCGEFIIDICAAPGGKSCAAAEKMQNIGKVLSFDIYDHKVKLIESSAKRLGIDIIEAKVHNGCEVLSDYIGRADRVLLDAPCSGLGVIHKKPDIKWNRRESDISELTKVQSQLIDTACQYVREGGILLYCTCTVLKEENQDITSAFLSSHDGFEKISEKQILTDSGGESGFYICKMKRNK